MDQSVDNAVSNMPEEIAIPRVNGELVFESPWEARVFGLAVALHEQGAFEWKIFSQSLTDEIASAEKEGESSSYYERWLRALHHVTTGQDLLATREIVDRTKEVQDQADHEHDDHGHDHPHHHHE
jgi:nitrile hydratase accessory protein